GIFGSSTQFYRRMKMLLQRDEPLASRCSRRWRIFSALTGGMVLTATALLAGVEPLAAEPAEPETKTDEVAPVAAESPQAEGSTEESARSTPTAEDNSAKPNAKSDLNHVDREKVKQDH